MAALRFGLLVLALGIAFLMAVPASSVNGRPAVIAALSSSGGATAVAQNPTASIVQAGVHGASTAKILQTLKNDHVPLNAIYLPNLNGRAAVTNGVVTPLYPAAPAPMGLGYFGVQSVGGKDVGTISYSQSWESVTTINSANALYLASSSPDIWGMQLNTVLTHVTVAGNTSGQYWIQNVADYFQSTQTLQLIDNIWNFSSPTAGMQTSTLYSFSGNIVAPVFYYAFGPSFHVTPPFTLRFFNNATVFNLRPTVYFNYSLTGPSGKTVSGSYDRAEFNSTGLAVPTTPAAPPTFQVNGKSFNPLGLLNDAEISIGGPGGGSTTTMLSLDARMALYDRPNGSTSYKNVPAGSSFGTDTGETSEGIAVWATTGSNPVAVLGAGPSLLQPLWGLVGAHQGSIAVTLHLTPSNAFVFANPGSTFNADVAGWAPVPTTGTPVYHLAPGTYTFEFLLSDHQSKRLTVTGTTAHTVTLKVDMTRGVYTPLWAWNNAQLAAISQAGGDGTVGNPYVLDNNVVGLIDPLFGEFNDFFFPVFPGVFLANTNAFVSVSNAPSFTVACSLAVEAAFCAGFGFPLVNNLQIELYNATDVSLVNTPVITGWFAANGPTFASNVMFWNSSHNLVAGNTFQVQSVGLILFGGTKNVIWGNTFVSATTSAVNPASILDSASPNGFQLYENGDLTYNNAFLTPMPAATPGFNFYTGAPQSWADRWNIPRAPATNVMVVNGFNLTGSILGLSWQGGNAWSNYGTAQNPYNVLPYNNGGLITSKGDFQPLLSFSLYRIKVTETGLTAGTNWSVTINGYNQTTSGSSMVFWEPNGTYAYVVSPLTGFTATPSSGAVVLNGAGKTVAVVWT